ncbi:New ORF [Mycoplasmoides pneumoniae M129]|nr:New ORF [Mycoplasmoides pneumoniae M129]
MMVHRTKVRRAMELKMVRMIKQSTMVLSILPSANF